jgi:hypothetical protein
MKRIIRSAVLVAALALPGCSDPFAISDRYGNSYGGYDDFGNQYAWQLSTCQDAPALTKTAPGDQKRWMECCMWRHGVPIEGDSAGCAAPPYFNG